MDEPLISVIMPVYNQKEEYLRKAINSVINQTYKNWELIIVDDGSDKPVDKAVLGLGQELIMTTGIDINDYKIRIFRKENGGVASALNEGIKQMEGQWFAWLSSDDIWTPDKLHHQVNFKLKNPDTLVIYTDWEYVDEKGNHVRYEVEPKFNDVKDMQFHLCQKFFGCGSSIMIHKSVFDDVGTFNEKYRSHEDYEMWFRIANKYMFYKVPVVLMQYRIHGKALRYTASAIGETFNEIREKGRELLNYYGNLDNVSVIVPAYNAQDTIEECLNTILNTKGVTEVFVINDASTDSTRTILNDMLNTSKNPKLIVIHNTKNVGRAITRNKGLKQASNSLIATIDCDVIPDGCWLESLKKKMDEMWLDICGGSVRWKSMDGGFWAEHYDFIQTQIAKKSLGTCLTLFKRSVLKDVGYLDENLTSGEDSEMMFRVQKKGYSFIKVPDLLGTHIENRNLFALLERHYEYGKDRAGMVIKHPEVVKGQYSENELQDNPAEIINVMNELMRLVGTLGFREYYLKNKDLNIGGT